MKMHKCDTNPIVGVPQIAELGDLPKEVTDKSIRPTQEFKGQNKSIKSRWVWYGEALLFGDGVSERLLKLLEFFGYGSDAGFGFDLDSFVWVVWFYRKGIVL
ncbi:hypothetical protein TB2_037648 [Malus domestica]